MIRNHSHYSLCLALSKPAEIVKRAKELGYEYVGITDYNTISSAIELTQECKKNNMKPIIGCEIQLEIGTITLICRNKSAWSQLIKVISTANNKENYKKRPTIKYDDLLSIINPDDFVCIDGYFGSKMFHEIYNYETDYLVLDKDLLNRKFDVNPYLEKMSIFKHYFLELFNEECESYPILNTMSSYIKDLPNTINYSCSYYVNRQDSVDHRILLCTRLKCFVKNLDMVISKDEPELSKFIHSSSFYIKNNGDFSKISDLCESFSILSKPRLPHFKCPDGLSEIEYLKELCRQGWKNKLSGKEKINTPEKIEIYKNRVLEELEVAERAGLAGYYLIVQDYVNEMKRRGVLVGAARGSAAGSLISFLINITTIDPIEYDLLFARFFNASRAFPDHVSFSEYRYLGDFIK